MRYVESKTDPQMHVCECPVHGLYHFGPKTISLKARRRPDERPRPADWDHRMRFSG